MICCYDVVSLFTNIPINETLDIIKKQLEVDTKLKLPTNLNVDNVMELLKFIVTTTYFSFRDTIYQQKFGTAMGSPVSPVVANLFMEWLEQQTILTAPITCKPKQWKRYVDDVMEHTGNIKFTYEEELDTSLPFLDTLMIRKEDETVKLLVYRKKTHSDQYHNFTC